MLAPRLWLDVYSSPYTYISLSFVPRGQGVEPWIQLEKADLVYSLLRHAKLSEHQALRHKLKSCTVPILYRSDLVKSRRMLYRPDVCNCTMPYVHRTVPAYAVRDPAYTAEVFALTLV